MRRFALLAPTALLTGCAAIIIDGTFEVPVESTPAGAAVYYRGQFVGTTPCRVPVDRSNRRIALTHPEFEPQWLDVGVERDPWLAGNLVTLGLGAFVDLALGTNNRPRTGTFRVHLRGPGATRLHVRGSADADPACAPGDPTLGGEFSTLRHAGRQPIDLTGLFCDW